jgi:glycyl-tRNA synthetase
VRPESGFLTGLSSTLASLFSILLVLFILQAFTEIRGVMPPYLGITEYLPPDIRAAIAVPYNAPPPLPSPLSPIKDPHLSARNTPAELEQSQLQPQLLRDIIPNSETYLLISCNLANNELLIEPHTPNPAFQLAEQGLEPEPSELHPEADSKPHPARQWTDISIEDRLSWKTQLINAGLWDPQEDEDEMILQSIFFRELCPHPQPSAGDIISGSNSPTGGDDSTRG